VIRKLRNGDLEAGLDRRHNLLIALRRLEGDGETLGAETAGATKVHASAKELNIEVEGIPDTVEITVCISRRVIVDNDIDTLHIDTTTENICRNENALLKCLERSITIDTENIH
jgi:hypothetical protein